ncbi:MAG: MBL fold metallo-hydrolase [Flavobacteriales bacterium]|nr:MBL fold metallo-hydrolase [Flavobacteriales bacterium]
MKIHHVRNATMIIETADQVLLIDPMIGPKGTMPPFSFIRSKPRKNPVVGMPEMEEGLLDRVTHCLITHYHPDHLDKDAIKFLAKNQTPITCSILDEKHLRGLKLNVVQTLDYWKRTSFLGGQIEGIPAQHGYGYVAKPTGNVMGFYLELPGEKSLYLSSDTIYTTDVEKVLKEYQPSISVVAAGGARFDIFKPLLMRKEDVIRFIQDAPGEVIANHMEAVNHCPTTRQDLRNAVIEKGLEKKTHIPMDGEMMEL